MFARVRDEYLRLRKRAIKKGIPGWALTEADSHADKALYIRGISPDAPNPGLRAHAYTRAVRDMLTANSLLRAFLKPGLAGRKARRLHMLMEQRARQAFRAAGPRGLRVVDGDDDRASDNAGASS